MITTVDLAYPVIGKQGYMLKFEPFLSARQMRRLRAAYAFSKEGHRSQQRDDGRRYFDHVRACSWIAATELQLFDDELHMTLLLHDIVEDTYLLTPESIEEFFGERVAIMVNLLTHRPGVSAESYVENLRLSERARVIGAKLIDRLHNLRTLAACTREKQLRQAAETQCLYLPLAQHLIKHIRPEYRWRAEYLHHELDQLVTHWLTTTS